MIATVVDRIPSLEGSLDIPDVGLIALVVFVALVGLAAYLVASSYAGTKR